MNFLKKLNFCQKNVLHFESVIARRIIWCQFVYSFDLTLYTHVAHKTHPIYTWTNNTPWHYTISTLHWSKRPFDWPHTLLSLTCPMVRNVHPPRHLIFTQCHGVHRFPCVCFVATCRYIRQIIPDKSLTGVF